MTIVPVTHDEGTKWDWPLQRGDGVVKVLEYEDHFEVGLEAHNFEPKDIDVKNIGDFLEIHMSHSVKDDQFGSITRSITRCYRLPKGADPSSIKSKLDGSGVLHITGDKKK